MEEEKESPQWWKPSWDKAPAWAGALALCGNGHWHWLSHGGQHHTLRGRNLVVLGAVAWSEVAKLGPRGLVIKTEEALRHWETRPNAKAVGLDAAGGQSHTSDGLEG